MRRIVDDLFSNNPQYKSTPLRPQEIIEPIGYSSLRHSTMIERPKTKRLELFQFPEEQLFKTIVNRRGLENEAMLEVNLKEAKGVCIGGQNLKYLEDRQAMMKGQIERVEWFPQQQDYTDTRIVQFMEVLASIQKDRLLAIEDYTLSHYAYFLDTANPTYELYLNELLNIEFIEYKVAGLHLTNRQYTASNAKWQEAQAINIADREQVKELMQQLNQTNQQLDGNYKGLHLFIGLRELQDSTACYQECERKFLPILQYYILLLSGTLADGQCAILRIYSNIRHKTNEFLFLLRTMFYKITVLKPLTSNLFLHEKFLICEGFKKPAGTKIHEHLYKHYDLLGQHGEASLLVKSADIFKADFHQHLQDFNNILVNRMLKPLYEKVLSNTGAIYVPNLLALSAKLKHLWFRHPIDELLDSIKKHYRFQGQRVSELKLSTPTPVEQSTFDRQREDRHDRQQYRPRGNSFRGGQSFQKRQFSGDRRYYHQDRR